MKLFRNIGKTIARAARAVARFCDGIDAGLQNFGRVLKELNQPPETGEEYINPETRLEAAIERAAEPGVIYATPLLRRFSQGVSRPDTAATTPSAPRYEPN